MSDSARELELAYCSTCNMRRYFKDGKCEMCVFRADRDKAIRELAAKWNSERDPRDASDPYADELLARLGGAECAAFEREKKMIDHFVLKTLEMLSALKAWEHWYSVDSTEFNRYAAREQGLKILEGIQ